MVAPSTINEFMNALQRLFKIGIYYPSGHATLDRATERFMKLLKVVAGNAPEVTITVQGENLEIAELTLTPEVPFVREFKVLLDSLGIISVGISKEITPAELLEFLRKMIFFRSQVLKTRTFRQIELEQLPLSITVRHKEFLARKNASISEDQAGERSETIEDFVESLKKHGLTPPEIDTCRELLEKLPERLATSSMDLAELPYASWDDVARLLARTVRGNRGDAPSGSDLHTVHTNINALAAILKKLEREAADSASRKAINLLISIIRKPLSGTEAEAPDGGGVQRIYSETPTFSVDQIQAYIAKNRLHPKILKNIPESSPAQETLSILLQLAQCELPLASQAKLQQLAREILSEPIQEKTWVILSGGLHHLLGAGRQHLFTPIFRAVAEPLRRSPHASSLYLLLLTARLCRNREILRIWPHIVNELLVCGSSSDESSFVALCRYASRPAPADMAACLEQLQELEAFQNTTIAPDIFPALPTECYPLFAFLMKTGLESFVTERVIGGLRRNPPEWLIKAAVHLLDSSNQEHKLFLYAYLRQVPSRSMPPALQTAAAKLIAAGLSGLTDERRNESWVPDTIAALARLPSEQTRALLEHIASERKLLFMHEWPSDCRKAAQQALAGGKCPR